MLRGFPGILTAVFIGLKLAGMIDWSWFWVLSPLIFVSGPLFLAAIGCLMLAAGIAIWEKVKR